MTSDARPDVGRVLFVTHNIPRFPGDAAGSFVLRLAVALRSLGVMVDVIAPGSPELQGHDVIEGVPIERVRYAKPAHMTLAYSGTMAESVRQSWSARFAFVGLLLHVRARIRARVREAARSGSPYRVVHAHWWFPSGVSAWSAGIGKSRALPLVITMHGSDVRLAQSVRPSHAIMKRVLMRARVRTAVSVWLASAAMRIVPEASVEVGPMPVDTSIFVMPSVATTRSNVLFVGRLNAQKGLADLLDAFTRVTNTKTQLIVVGAGADEATLKVQAAARGIAHRIQWLGALKQSEILPLYQSAAVVAMPSRDEGLGLVAVEAQLCGTPVVAYASGGLTDVVLPSAGGTLVEVGDVEAFGAALNTYVNSSSQSAELIASNGAKARDAMLHSFSPDAVARKYIAWYQQALRT
jgi:glycosyltransferase involved in cell wall biosynthesis